MNTVLRFFISLMFLISINSLNSNACTTFCIKDKNGTILFGRNYDFPIGLGHIQINQRDIQKTSFISVPEKPFIWISKYGSISFNQNGREFPNGGMNEAGLVVELMMLDETVYPKQDDRFGLTELQWIQYQLDVSASVEDVIKSDNLVRVSYTSIAPLHFSVADAKGNFATIEYINGKMVYHKGESLKYPVLANETYETGCLYKNKYDADKKAFADQRFVVAASLIDSLDKNKDVTVDIAFDILNNVAQGDWTRWSIVYDISKRTIIYKTGVNKNIRQLRLSDFDFSNSSKKLFLDIDDDFKTVSDFKEYNFDSNFKLVDTVWNGLEGFLKDLPNKMEWARYPDDVNNQTIRKFKFSAAKKILEIMRTTNSIETKKAEIQKIVEQKDDFYLSEAELSFNAGYLVNEKKFEDALVYYKIIVEQYPQSSKAHAELGEVYALANNSELAIESFKKSLAINPENKTVSWEMDALKARENKFILDKTVLESYAGVFGERTITYENGELYFQRKGQEKLKIVPMTTDLFMFEEIDYLRIKMIKENDKVVAIEAIYNDGNIIRCDKTN